MPTGSAKPAGPPFLPSDVPKDDEALPCPRKLASKDELCACVRAVLAVQDTIAPNAPTTCEVTRPLSADGRLVLLEASTATIGERYVADLSPGASTLLVRAGRSAVVNPRLGLGAKGTYTSRLEPIEERLDQQPPHIVVRWEIETSGPTEGGSLSEITAFVERRERWAAYCVPPSSPETPPRCNVVALTELTIEHSRSAHPGVKPKVKKTVTQTQATLEGGELVLKRVKGDDDLPRGSVGRFRL